MLKFIKTRVVELIFLGVIVLILVGANYLWDQEYTTVAEELAAVEEANIRLERQQTQAIDLAYELQVLSEEQAVEIADLEALLKEARKHRSRADKLERDKANQVEFIKGLSQEMSDAVRFEGIKEFYRGLFVHCILDTGTDLGGTAPPQEEVRACELQSEAELGRNLHHYTFPASGERLNIPPTFDPNLSVPFPVIKLKPLVPVSPNPSPAPGGN
jgi:hypothetical protein